MTIFAVLMPSPQPGLASTIENTFPDDHMKLSDTQYLVSAGGTAIDLSRTLGLVIDPKKQNAQASGVAVVLATSSYYGRAPATVWDWMKAKLEASSNG